MKTRHGIAVALTLLPALAVAHPGHELSAGSVMGLLHSLTGIDHLLAMLAVGAWAAQLGGGLRWWVPVSFVSLMLLSALLGMSGVQIGAVEQGIAASVCILGLLLAAAVRLPAALCVLLAGGFALFHGYAHGVEAPQQANAMLYLAGFVCSTIALHVAGLVMGSGLRRYEQHTALRWSGVAMTVGGLALFAA